VQRAVLARELSSEVDVLIVANPVLRPRLRRRRRDPLAASSRQRNRGAAVLLVSEDLDEILQLSDRIVVMSDGKLALQTAAASAVGAIGRAHGGTLMNWHEMPTRASVSSRARRGILNFCRARIPRARDDPPFVFQTVRP
jgi:ABC-type multidrug transport system ATPase subunit